MSRPADPRRRDRYVTWILLAGILLCAFGVRAWHLLSGVPYAVGIDEPAVVDRALRILQTGDWNPHVFDYPTLVIYMHALVAVATFLLGASRGAWASVTGLDIGAVYETGRIVAAAIGTATVWLTYRIGKELDSRALGLVAAAQLAVFPMHVRESHFILTDVPATALVTLTLYLTLRAARDRTVSAYAWAGCAAGLSAAAKYNGGVVAAVVGLTWLIYERAAADRGPKALAALMAMGVAFIVTVPYAILDLPAFLNGLGAQLARFSSGNERPGDQPWRTYLGHLSLAWNLWVPTAVLGAFLVLWRRRAIGLWLVPIAFVVTYFYVLASHAAVFGRYALPLVPAMCVLSAVPVIELAKFLQTRFAARSVTPATLVVGALAMTVTFAVGSIEWLSDFGRPDTRMVATRWMTATLPKGTRIVVENGAPTYLDSAGFEIVNVDDRPPAQYSSAGVEYVVTASWSSIAPPDEGPGRVVFSVDPSSRRWGPFVRVRQLSRPN